MAATVLIIDDEGQLRKLLSRIISLEGSLVDVFGLFSGIDKQQLVLADKEQRKMLLCF